MTYELPALSCADATVSCQWARGERGGGIRSDKEGGAYNQGRQTARTVSIWPPTAVLLLKGSLNVAHVHRPHGLGRRCQRQVKGVERARALVMNCVKAKGIGWLCDRIQSLRIRARVERETSHLLVTVARRRLQRDARQCQARTSCCKQSRLRTHYAVNLDVQMGTVREAKRGDLPLPQIRLVERLSSHIIDTVFGVELQARQVSVNPGGPALARRDSRF